MDLTEIIAEIKKRRDKADREAQAAYFLGAWDGFFARRDAFDECLSLLQQFTHPNP